MIVCFWRVCLLCLCVVETFLGNIVGTFHGNIRYINKLPIIRASRRREWNTHVVELPTANRSICGRSPGLSFTHLSASMAVVGVRQELVQATEACSAVRTCARWPEGRLSSASSIVLELDSTKITCSPAGELESRSAARMVTRPRIVWD